MKHVVYRTRVHCELSENETVAHSGGADSHYLVFIGLIIARLKMLRRSFCLWLQHVSACQRKLATSFYTIDRRLSIVLRECHAGVPGTYRKFYVNDYVVACTSFDGGSSP